MVLTYAGIGSRETPADILDLMRRIALSLAKEGHVLRSGAAPGADTAFEQGCDAAHGPKEIYLPWNGFNDRKVNNNPSVFLGANEYTYEIAARYHPNWSACSRGARSLHARNVCQVLGFSRDKPADLLICWTPYGRGEGGTGQAIRIANAYKIPVFDLYEKTTMANLREFIRG